MVPSTTGLGALGAVWAVACARSARQLAVEADGAIIDWHICASCVAQALDCHAAHPRARTICFAIERSP